MEHFQSDETRQDKTRQDSDSEDLAIWRSGDLAMSCLVLSCLVLSCLVLSRLVLSCLVLSCLVLSCLLSWRASISLYFPYTKNGGTPVPSDMGRVVGRTLTPVCERPRSPLLRGAGDRKAA